MEHVEPKHKDKVQGNRTVSSNGEEVTMATAPGHKFALGAIEANGANGTLGTQWN